MSDFILLSSLMSDNCNNEIITNDSEGSLEKNNNEDEDTIDPADPDATC